MKARYWPWSCVKRGAVAGRFGQASDSFGIHLRFGGERGSDDYRIPRRTQPVGTQLSALLIEGGAHFAGSSARRAWSRGTKASATRVIAAPLNVSGSTIYRTKRRLVASRLEGALSGRSAGGCRASPRAPLACDQLSLINAATAELGDAGRTGRREQTAGPGLVSHIAAAPALCRRA